MRGIIKGGSPVFNIAILEDDASASQMLQYILNTYAGKNGVTFNIKVYASAELFLSETKTSFDIAFMDVELPGMNGMDAAFKLREADKHVIIIFVTNMAQYAVRGYEVNALYYIIKPISYQSVAFKLKKALSLLATNTEATLVLRQSNGLTRITTASLMYIEISNHKLMYHTDSAVLTTYGSLSDAEKQLQGRGFFRCNSCYLVNARYIASVSGLSVLLLDGTQLQISHPRKRQFLLDLGAWLGDGNS